MRFDAHAHKFILLSRHAAAAGISFPTPPALCVLAFYSWQMDEMEKRVVLVCLKNRIREVHLQAGDEDSAETAFSLGRLDAAVREKFADVSSLSERSHLIFQV